ncbi:MAG: hypothetical protein WA688_10055 [Thermoplasmata archaeon]
MSVQPPPPVGSKGVPIPPGAPRVADVGPLDPKGLRWIATGAGLGLTAAATGLAIPVALVLLATYSPTGLLRFGPTLIQATGLLAVVGTLLFAVSLIAFRYGFAAFRKFERWFWSASILCLIGTVGWVLLILPAGIALLASNALFLCVQAAPTKALVCIQSVTPLAGYVAVIAFWLVWVGQLGIVVGLALTGRRFRETLLHAGTALYALLLLVFIAPFIGLVFVSGALSYAVIATVALGLLAPACVAYGCGRPDADARRLRRRAPARSALRLAVRKERADAEASAGTGI